MRSDRGNEQLDNLSANVVNFPNMVGDEIDLTQYMEDEVRHRIKSAREYQDGMICLLIGEDESNHGQAMPWNALAGRFDLRKHEMTVWTGFKGHGKSLLISQVLVAMMKRQQKMFIVSPEFRPERVLERMLYQFIGSKIVDAEDIKSFMAWAEKHVWLYDNQASLKPNDVVALCRYAARALEVDHILIDSLMKCGMAPDDHERNKHFIDKIQSVCHQYPLHLHLVAHARKGNDDEKPAKLHDIKGTSEIADMAENVLSVWRNKPKEKKGDASSTEADCTLTVEAQRNGDGWIGMIPLLFDKESMLFYEFGNHPERIGRAYF